MLAGLSQRARVAILALVATALAFFVFGGLRGGGGVGASGAEPERAIPRDSFLVASVRLAELRRSPIYEVVLGKDPAAPMLGARALGLGRIARLADACGFDPLSRVSELAVAVPEDGDKGELGVAAHIDVTTDELSKCAGALADQRGGKVETKDIGHFVVVEDSQSGESLRPRLAYGRGGLLVAGRGAWFDAMLAAAEGTRPSVRDAAGHAAMRTSLTSREGWRAPTVLVTTLLPRSLRDRIKGEMGAEIGSRDTSQALMAGVLGVSSVGLAIRAGASGQNVDAAVELVCDDGDACAAVEKLILKKRHDWSKELMLRMVGFGPALDSIDVKREGPGGARVRITASAAADALASTVDRVLRFSGGGGGAVRGKPDASGGRGGPAFSPPGPLPARSADETIAAPRRP